MCVCVITVIIKWLISIRGIPWFLFLSPTSFSLQFYIILIALLPILPLLLIILSSPFSSPLLIKGIYISTVISLIFLSCFQLISTSALSFNFPYCLLISSPFYMFFSRVSLVFSSSAAVHDVLPGQVLSQWADENQGRAHQVKTHTLKGLFMSDWVKREG